MPIDGSCHKKLKAGVICENCEVVVGSPEDMFTKTPPKAKVPAKEVKAPEPEEKK